MFWSFEKGTIFTPYSKNLALQKHMSIAGLMSRLSLIGIDATWQLSLECLLIRTRALPTLYWLPKLHKWPYNSRFIANCSSYTTTFDFLPHWD